MIFFFCSKSHTCIFLISKQRGKKMHRFTTALALLCSGSPVMIFFSRQTFIFARNFLVRTLASGTTVAADKLNRAAHYRAAYPASQTNAPRLAAPARDFTRFQCTASYVVLHFLPIKEPSLGLMYKNLADLRPPIFSVLACHLSYREKTVLKNCWPECEKKSL